MQYEIHKDIIFGKEVREKISQGVNTLANAVEVTLGPKGRNVILETRMGVPHITKDGVSVAKQIYLKDKFENLGAQMIRQVSEKTAVEAGDGTTTSTVLARAMINNGLKLVEKGASPISIKRQMDETIDYVVEELKKHSTPISSFESLKDVATISANGDATLGSIIAKAIDRVGKDGIVTVEDSADGVTKLEVLDGMKIDAGLNSPYFVTNHRKMCAEHKNLRVLIINGSLSYLDNLLPVLERAAKEEVPVLIIADEVGGTAMKMLVENFQKGILKVAVVTAPSFGDNRKVYLEDIASITGTKVFGGNQSLKNIKFEDLGYALSLTSYEKQTVIVGAKKDSSEAELRKSAIMNALEEETDQENIGFLRDRLGRFTGAISVIKAGGRSDVEVKELKDRIDDAISATKAALAEGIVPGAGVTLYRIQKNGLPEHLQTPGSLVVLEAMEQPFKAILNNAGINPEHIEKNLFKDSFKHGYNVSTNKYVDLVADGVVDPTKVVRVALQNASSVAGMILTTDAIVGIDRESIRIEYV